MEIDLPKNWEIVKISKVGELLRGVNYKKEEAVNEPKDGYVPVLRGNNINGDLNFDDLVYVLQKNVSTQQIVKANDIVFAMSSGSKHLVGKSAKAKADFNGSFGAFCGLLRPNDNVNKSYLAYFFKSSYYKKYISEISKGTNINNLKREHILDLEFPLAPDQEQNQIVEKIEELFSELDKGIENLKTAQQQLKVYRQAVLKWAFVNDTFKEYIANDITEKIQIGPFGTQLHKEDYIENGIPLINPTHIKDGLIVSDKSFTILESKRESLPNYILKEGDVIMGRRGEMARCGLVSKKEAGWFCGTGSLYFRPNLKLVDPVFLYHNLRSEPVKKYLEENAGGTTMANLNLKIVNNIPISIPSIEQQKAIVLEIESRLSVCDKMEETISTSLQQAEALRQSILKRAFEGKLVKEII